MIQLSIMSAEAKRAETDLRNAQREAYQRMIEQQRPARVEKLIEQVFNFAKSKIEKAEYGSCQVTITEDEIFLWKPWSDDELREAVCEVVNLLRIADYDVREFHEYSKGWKTRSGKFGYIYIFW